VAAHLQDQMGVLVTNRLVPACAITQTCRSGRSQFVFVAARSTTGSPRNWTRHRRPRRRLFASRFAERLVVAAHRSQAGFLECLDIRNAVACYAQCGFGERLAGAVAYQWVTVKMRSDLQHALMTTVLDGVGAGSGKACWALMRGARANMFGFASRGKIFQLHQKLLSSRPKKPDSYWFAPDRTPARENPSNFSR
jgi:hypothetical protein